MDIWRARVLIWLPEGFFLPFCAPLGRDCGGIQAVCRFPRENKAEMLRNLRVTESGSVQEGLGRTAIPDDVPISRNPTIHDRMPVQGRNARITDRVARSCWSCRAADTPT